MRDSLIVLDGEISFNQSGWCALGFIYFRVILPTVKELPSRFIALNFLTLNITVFQKYNQTCLLEIACLRKSLLHIPLKEFVKIYVYETSTCLKQPPFGIPLLNTDYCILHLVHLLFGFGLILLHLYCLISLSDFFL